MIFHMRVSNGSEGNVFLRDPWIPVLLICRTTFGAMERCCCFSHCFAPQSPSQESLLGCCEQAAPNEIFDIILDLRAHGELVFSWLPFILLACACHVGIRLVSPLVLVIGQGEALACIDTG